MVWEKEIRIRKHFDNARPAEKENFFLAGSLFLSERPDQGVFNIGVEAKGSEFITILLGVTDVTFSAQRK